MTKPELFGLPKWLTEKEEELLAAGYRYTFDVDLQPSDVALDTKSIVDNETSSVRVRATSDSPYYGSAGTHYFSRRSLAQYLQLTDDPLPHPPYFLYRAAAPFDVGDLLDDLRQTYGLYLTFGDVAYALGDTIPEALSWPLELKLRDTSFRYQSGSLPVYAAPQDLAPLIRLVTPGRWLPDSKDLFQDVDIASAGQVQYQQINAVGAHEYLKTLPSGYVFSEVLADWEFGSQYLIPVAPGEAEGWVSQPTQRFQNIYNAQVVYNGRLRVSDPVPRNTKLTHVLVLKLDPAYSYRATGLVRAFYTFPDWRIPLGEIWLQRQLSGLTYEPPRQDIPLSSILRVTQLSGLWYVPRG